MNNNTHSSPNNKRRIHRCISIIILSCLHLRLVSIAAAAAAAAATAYDQLFTRFDSAAYLAARRGRGGVDNEDGGTGSGSGYEGVLLLDSYEYQHPTKDDDDIQNNRHHHHNYDDPNKCTLYLAPSSIPNSGLGVYTTIPYSQGDAFFPEIGILFHDKHRQHIITEDGSRLSAQYPWQSSTLSLGAFDAHYAESFIPGLGMLVNSHSGLVNTRLSERWMVQRSMDGTDSFFREDSLTLEDVGRGAHATHNHVMFEAVSNIEAGEELFVSYGDEWFTVREETLGIVPGGDDFREADEMLRTFAETQNNNNNNLRHDQLLFGREKVEGNGDKNNAHDDDLDTYSAAYEELLREASEKSKRLRAALPDNVQGIPFALHHGTARFSAKDSIQSLEWLEENGACLDNIVSGVSSIPQAGRGAFATRSIKEGEQITTTPVITFDREELLLWETVERMDDGGMVMELIGEQLLFNYCYGHTNSSLLLFPYAPTVNFINHGSVEDSNAEIRWSTSPYHHSEWLDEPLDDVKRRMKTGLMLDIIATKKLYRGDEILLYYGKDWEDSWNRHILEWSTSLDSEDTIDPHLNITDRLGLPTASALNEIEKNPIVRTVEEQVDEPYPPFIMTLCRFVPPEECPAQSDVGDTCVSRWRNDYQEKHIYPCSILSRQFEYSSGMHWYTAQVEVTETEIHLVNYMQRHAILFSNRPYSKDQYARGIFRHFIGVPDGVLPMHWMDLNSTSECDDASEVITT